MVNLEVSYILITTLTDIRTSLNNFSSQGFQTPKILTSSRSKKSPFGFKFVDLGII